MMFSKLNCYSNILVFLFILGNLNGATGFPALHAYHSVSSLSLSGAGYLHSSVLSKNINPAVYDDRQFSASIIKYPSQITSQSVGIALPILNNLFCFSLNNISYGVFNGYDDSGVATDKYYSRDTHFKFSFSKKHPSLPIKIGLSSNYFFSEYQNYKIKVLNLSCGVIYNISKYQTKLGISFQNWGMNFSDLNVSLSNETVLSSSTKLKHLPLRLYFDFVLDRHLEPSSLFTGGVFQINKKLKLFFGSGSRKLDQNTKQNIYKSIVGSTSVGFSYLLNTTSIRYGVYNYGTGAIVQGVEIGIEI